MRLVGAEDGWFEPYRPGRTLISAVLTDNGRIESVGVRWITVDGDDVTERLLELLSKVRCDAVILGGISFAGFNLVDSERVQLTTGVPLVVYIQEDPDTEAMLTALRKRFKNWEVRWRRVEALGEVYPMDHEVGHMTYFESVGASRTEAEKILRDSILYGRIPEPIRLAKLVARGLTRSS